jgi:GMP synthase (glutamine-hydrolysing)
MDKKILIIKNKSSEGPGILEILLRRKNINYTIVDLESDPEYPSSLESVGAVVMLGGPDSANDVSKKIGWELAFIDRILSDGIPYLGICLGLQVLVKAAGGKVLKNIIKETGFRDPENKFFSVVLTSEGKTDAIFKGLGNEFPVFHLHGETVELTDKMTLLAAGAFCRNQVVKIGENAYGIQCHFELTPEMLEYWITTDPDLLELDTENLRNDFNYLKNDYTSTGETILNNFLNIAGV